jgi:hypothetical protein
VEHGTAPRPPAVGNIASSLSKLVHSYPYMLNIIDWGSFRFEKVDPIDSLREQVQRLEYQIQLATLAEGISVEEANTAIVSHIDRLHVYNEIKDLGQIVFGRAAEMASAVCFLTPQEELPQYLTRFVVYPPSIL